MRSRIWAWVAVGAVVALSAAIRLRLLDVPLDRDEGEYAYFGQLLLDGIPPYAQAYNLKLPGIYGVYALVMATFGQTPAAIRTGLILTTSARPSSRICSVPGSLERLSASAGRPCTQRSR